MFAASTAHYCQRRTKTWLTLTTGTGQLSLLSFLWLILGCFYQVRSIDSVLLSVDDQDLADTEDTDRPTQPPILPVVDFMVFLSGSQHRQCPALSGGPRPCRHRGHGQQRARCPTSVPWSRGRQRRSRDDDRKQTGRSSYDVSTTRDSRVGG